MEQIKKRMSAEFLDQLILNDFPTSTNYVFQMLEFALMYPNQADFYQKIDVANVKDFDEYMETKMAASYNLLPPDEIPPETQAKIDLVNKLIAELKQALLDKKPMKEIYEILKKFKVQLDFNIPTIPSLE